MKTTGIKLAFQADIGRKSGDYVGLRVNHIGLRTKADATIDVIGFISYNFEAVSGIKLNNLDDYGRWNTE